VQTPVTQKSPSQFSVPAGAGASRFWPSATQSVLALHAAYVAEALGGVGDPNGAAQAFRATLARV
jgi:hypothetical protein